MYKATEKRFEKQIEVFLKSTGYKVFKNENYTKKLCLIKKSLIVFIKNTQSKKYQILEKQLFEETDNQICSRLDKEISTFGIIHVLKKGFNVRDQKLKIFITIPRSSNNSEHLIDYEKNELSLIRQLKFSEKTEQSIDTVIFLNGVPIITIELKNQLTNQNIEDAITQYKKDRDPINKLLSFNRCIVHFGADNDQVVMTTELKLSSTRFFPFNKGIYNPITYGYKSEYLWKEILLKDNIINILERFAHISTETSFVYSNEKGRVYEKETNALIFPRYHQLEVIKKIETQLKEEGAGKNFLIKHTTGSGKSYEIGWLAHMLSSFYRTEKDEKKLFDTVIVVTDRTVLDEQLRGVIENLEDISGVVNSVTEDSNQLKEFLESNKSIIVTTIQKFPIISKSIKNSIGNNFAVIFDEVHSSQGGKSSAELKKTLAQKENSEQDDYENIVVNEIKSKGNLKNVSFFGFTGTPKPETLEIFGRYKDKTKSKKVPFHEYTMEQSIHEGFTLDVLKNFTYFKRYFKLKELNKDIELSSKKIKSQIFSFVDDQEITIENKIEIILDHFISKVKYEMNNNAKGMIITSSRKHCVRYFKKFNEELKKRNEKFRCIVGFSKFEDEEEDIKYDERELNREVGLNEEVRKGLKYPEFKILIVSNKFQTGFDEPNLYAMYVDKNLNDTQCVQTLSRLNRVAPGKKRTFVLDFKNSPEKTQSNFQKFYGNVSLISEADPEQIHDILTKIKNFNFINYEDVKEFNLLYQEKPNVRQDEKLQKPLNHSVEKWTMFSEEEKIESKSLLKKFVDFYDLIIQIIDYQNIEHFEYYIFFENLITKLQITQNKTRDISEYLRLISLKIDKNFEGSKKLIGNEFELKGFNPENQSFIDDKTINLKELIKEINNIYGLELTDEDEVKFDSMRNEIKNEKIIEIVKSDNTPTDSKKKIYEELKKITFSKYDNDFEFYKKMTDNPNILKGLSNIIYNDIIKNL